MTIDPDVRTIAQQFGVDAALIQAVVNAEGNIVKAVQCSIPSVTTRPQALTILCRSAVHALSDYVKAHDCAGFVDFWQARWAPTGAANDPTDLNRNWSTNVKKFLGVTLLVLIAVPAVAQTTQQIVERQRAKFGPTISVQEAPSLLRAIATDLTQTLGSPYGLLPKASGNQCGGYACDIICNASFHWDVLGDGPDATLNYAGAGTPQWNLVGAVPRACELVGLSTPPMTGPPSPPQPAPSIQPTAPSLDLSPILARLDAIYAQSERIYADETNQRTAQTATILDAVNSPGWFRSVLGNRYVQMALAGVATYVTTHQAMK